MKLPNGHRAVVDRRKIEEYCLSPVHPRGRHKARLFTSMLGLTAEHADQLRDALLLAARSRDASSGERDSYGQRYLIDFPMSGPRSTGTVRSTWIVLVGEDFPRLTSCYVL